MRDILESEFTLTTDFGANRELRHYIQTLLRGYNAEVAGLEVAHTKPVTIAVCNQAGQIVGGLVGHISWEWLVVDVLAVESVVRRKGLGTQLMAQAEAIAREHGCRYAHTSTYAHQALEFYQRLGYSVIGRLADYPEGYTLVWLRKTLQHKGESQRCQ